MKPPGVGADDEPSVRAMLAIAGIPASDEEVRSLVAGLPGLSEQVAALWSVSETRYADPALGFSAIPPQTW